jgi:hypothetical protein
MADDDFMRWSESMNLGKRFLLLVVVVANFDLTVFNIKVFH